MKNDKSKFKNISHGLTRMNTDTCTCKIVKLQNSKIAFPIYPFLDFAIFLFGGFCFLNFDILSAI
jgi:hypothetical protein